MTADEFMDRLNDGLAQVATAGRTPAVVRIGSETYAALCAHIGHVASFGENVAQLRVFDVKVEKSPLLFEAIIVETTDGMPFPVTP